MYKEALCRVKNTYKRVNKIYEKLIQSTTNIQELLFTAYCIEDFSSVEETVAERFFELIDGYEYMCYRSGVWQTDPDKWQYININSLDPTRLSFCSDKYIILTTKSVIDENDSITFEIKLNHNILRSPENYSDEKLVYIELFKNLEEAKLFCELAE